MRNSMLSPIPTNQLKPHHAPSFARIKADRVPTVGNDLDYVLELAYPIYNILKPRKHYLQYGPPKMESCSWTNHPRGFYRKPGS